MLRRLLCLSVTVIVCGPAAADGQAGPQVNWTQGPAQVSLGAQAELRLGTDLVFAGAADTRRLMESMGNSVSSREVGLVTSSSKDSNWILIFEYNDDGHVKDDEKNAIDKDALFESIKEGTEEGNKRRKELGLPGLHVTHWVEAPHYDQATHNLVWALAAKDDSGDQVVNYNMRVLGRQGYMSVTLVDDPGRLAASKLEAAAVMNGFSYKAGHTYAEFREGDRLAEYGLAGLVAAGAGATAAKMGLLAKLGKLLAKGGKALLLALVALAAWVRRLLAGKSARTADA
jgi:uncharacterized membrane-anchored protein